MMSCDGEAAFVKYLQTVYMHSLKYKMSAGRGALIVLEGCDRAGKSTQAKMLINALSVHNIPVESRCFPDRTTPIGAIIDQFLKNKQKFSYETIHLLFSANRWERKDEILKTLHSGITIVIDRYAGSGSAYGAASTGQSLNWCKQPDKGLPAPDLVIYLNVSNQTLSLRNKWGDEHFENEELQQLVASNYKKLMDKTWYTVNADDDISTIHSQILEKVLSVVNHVKGLPVSELYQ